MQSTGYALKRKWRALNRIGLAALAASPLLPAPMMTAAAAQVIPTKPLPDPRCDALKTLGGDSFKVLEAQAVAAGPTPPFYGEAPTRTAPDHCLLRGSFGKRAGAGGRTFEIRFELRMPRGWNGRFVFEGGGNMDGVDWPAYGSIFSRLSPTALDRGFAVVRTNSGHDSPNGDSLDATWAVDQQSRNDYGFVALDKVTVAAKSLVAAYYGRPADHSYFIGCSNGGRQAMLAAQKFPTYFDGIVAGDPAFNLTRIAPRLAWTVAELSKIAQPGVGAFSPADMKLLSSAVVKACDKLDGAEDGLVQDVASCRFKPAVLMCKGGKKTEACLSKVQVDAIDRIVAGPKDAQGKPYYEPLPFDSTPPPWSGAAAADPMGENLFLRTIRYFAMTPPDPKLDPRTISFPDVFPRLISTAAVVDAEGTMMNVFANHSKLIIYNGTSDYSLSVFELAKWYDALARDTGGTTQDWARLFLVPGMRHCSGGRATDQFDPLTAIQAWVEEGKAPERMVATGKELPGISRPLCAWPKVARYKAGDPNKAESFECR
jgi:feruloyl esterase